MDARSPHEVCGVHAKSRRENGDEFAVCSIKTHQVLVDVHQLDCASEVQIVGPVRPDVRPHVLKLRSEAQDEVPIENSLIATC